MSYLALPKEKRARFDPMITGFNPADMYAADHVRRVLETFPGVFVGIGEFSIHKEFVTSKVAGDPPSLDDPALDRLFDFAGEVGLVVLVHCDADTPFPKPGAEPSYWAPMRYVKPLSHSAGICDPSNAAWSERIVISSNEAQSVQTTLASTFSASIGRTA